MKQISMIFVLAVVLALLPACTANAQPPTATATPAAGVSAGATCDPSANLPELVQASGMVKPEPTFTTPSQGEVFMVLSNSRP